jgi:type II secretory pathway pseudopilin PulG
MRNQKGQSLIEALVALGIATIVVSAIAIATITAVNNADFSKYQNQASNYAQQGMEILRQQSQADWSSFVSKAGAINWCLDYDTVTLRNPGATPCSKNINNFFVRTVQLSSGIGGSACEGNVQANVVVSWTDGKCASSTDYCHNVTLTSCIANLSEVPAP